MTREEKKLLFKDLCARLPYGVVVRCTDSDTDYNCFLTTDILHEIQHGYEYYDYKPYLRPLSSMTEEEYQEFGYDVLRYTPREFDWLIARHFDYRGLIPIGLALRATRDMYKTK